MLLKKSRDGSHIFAQVLGLTMGGRMRRAGGFIAVDWGTTNRRGYLIDETGAFDATLSGAALCEGGERLRRQE